MTFCVRGVRQLLETIRVEFGLPYVPGLSGGAHALFLGAFPFASQATKERIALLLEPLEIDENAKISVDPIGHLFGGMPVCACSTLKAALTAVVTSNRSEVLALAEYNQWHLFLFRDRLQLLIHTCLAHADLVNGTTRVADYTSLCHRLQQQCFHLLLSPRDHSFPATLKSAFKEQYQRPPSAEELWDLANKVAVKELKKTHPKFRRHQNWREPIIWPRTSWEKFKKTGGVSISLFRAERRRLRANRKRRIFLLVQASVAEINDAGQQQAVFVQNKAERNSFRWRCQNSDLSLSANVPNGGITQTQFLKLIHAARESTNTSGALMVLAQCLLFLKDVDLPAATTLKRSGGTYLTTSYAVRHPSQGDQIEKKQQKGTAVLHIQSEHHFWRRIPTDLVAQIQALLASGEFDALCEERDEWLFHHGISRYQLVRCLRYNAPVWFGYPWLAAEVGLAEIHRGERIKMPGYLHYSAFTPAWHEQRLLAWYNRLGWPTPPDPAIGEVPSCGSANCVHPSIARELFVTLDSLLSSPLPSAWEELRIHLNAISALTRLVEILLTFQRNYPANPPEVSWDSEGCHLLQQNRSIHEKIRPRIITFPPVLQRLLCDVAAVFQQGLTLLYKQNLRPAPESDLPLHALSYGFLSPVSERRRFSVSKPRRVLIVNSLFEHPKTSPLASMHGNAMRNLSYYLLSSCSGLDINAMELHDHIPSGGKGILSKYRSNYEGEEKIRTTAALHILNQLKTAAESPWPHRFETTL